MTAVTVGAWLGVAAFLVASWSRINARRSWRLAALVLVLALSLAHRLLYPTVAGDAYVTFRYAHNLAEGYGPVFNPGEYVEGYPNFLWLALLALPGLLFGATDAIEGFAVVLGSVCLSGALPLVHRLTNRIVRLARPGAAMLPGLGVVAAALAAATSSPAAFGAAGAETSLLVLLVLVCCYALVTGRPLVAGVVVALAVMTRPEAVVVAVVGLVWWLVEARRGRATALAFVSYVLGALVLLVPWTAWRLTVYERLWPNVVVAHLAGPWRNRLADGWDYVVEFVVAYQVLLVPAVLVVGLATTRRRRAGAALWLLMSIALAYTALVVAVGGDRLPVWRMLAPVPVLVAVAATSAYGLLVTTGTTSAEHGGPRAEQHPWRESFARGRAVPAVALAVCGLCLAVTMVHPNALPAVRNLERAEAQLAEVGTWLARSLPSGTVVSTAATGALAHAAGPSIVVVDTFGRTDEHIALRGRWAATPGQGPPTARDFDYVVNTRSPAVAVEGFGYTPGQRCGIDPAYAGLYEVASFRRVSTSLWVSVYVRRITAAGLVELLDADPRYEYVPCG